MSILLQTRIEGMAWRKRSSRPGLTTSRLPTRGRTNSQDGRLKKRHEADDPEEAEREAGLSETTPIAGALWARCERTLAGICLTRWPRLVRATSEGSASGSRRSGQ